MLILMPVARLRLRHFTSLQFALVRHLEHSGQVRLLQVTVNMAVDPGLNPARENNFLPVDCRNLVAICGVL